MATTTPLGFQKPVGGDALRDGDNVISANAQKMEDLVQADRGRLGAIEAANVAQGTRLTAAESGITSATSRVAAVESVNTAQNGRLTAAESTLAATSARVTSVESGNTTRDNRITGVESTNVTQETRIGSFESQIAGLSAQVASVSTPFNIGVDTDGVPYYSDGASGLALEADTDGVPYFL